MNTLRRGLYAITSSALCADDAVLLAGCAAALRGGAVLLQYRDKQADAATQLHRARALAALCREHGAQLIINDDAQLAAASGADGAHLGRSDGALQAARTLLGPDAVLGASCGPLLERAHEAVQAGASYVAFGRFFDSRTKPDAPAAPLSLLAEARAQLSVPICAIGGLTPDNAAPLVAAGAQWIAAVDGVFADVAPTTIEAAARRYAALFA